MLETVKKPNTFYATYGSVVNPVETDKEINDYYWTSYSRGTDGYGYPICNPNINNIYLDGYNQQRSKSIFDPCPYGFRLPVGGSCNLFSENYVQWQRFSFIAGAVFSLNNNKMWISGVGYRHWSEGFFCQIGIEEAMWMSTVQSDDSGYLTTFYSHGEIHRNRQWYKSICSFVRCIEDCNYKKRASEKFRSSFLRLTIISRSKKNVYKK